jgi:hypothetical protein
MLLSCKVLFQARFRLAKLVLLRHFSKKNLRKCTNSKEWALKYATFLPCLHKIETLRR